MILTFGSINADFIVRVPKLPQLGETVLGGSHELLPGGKGANQAVAAVRAGGDVTFLGAYGADSFGEIRGPRARHVEIGRVLGDAVEHRPDGEHHTGRASAKPLSRSTRACHAADGISPSAWAP